MTGDSLALLTRAEQMLAEVVTAQDAASLVDMAEAARVFAKQAKLGTASVNHATAIKLKAEIRLAECVEVGQAAGEIATQDKGGANIPNGVRGADTVTPVTLDALGVDRRRLEEARKIRQHYTPEAIDATIGQATAEDVTVARKDFVKGTAHVVHNSGENEWYTPGVYLIAARATFWDDEICPDGEHEYGEGCECPEITTDPASSDIAQRTVNAKHYFTAETDGLAQEWHGNVWMNPPYAQPLIGRFINKLCEELDAGRVRAAIVLVNNATETEWGNALLTRADAVCFPKGRIRFLDRTGNPSGAPLQGQMVAYLAGNAEHDRVSELIGWEESKYEPGIADRFCEAFAHLGPVMRRG